MKGTVAALFKSQRLIRLIMLVNAKKSFTVGELADELGVSKRTISRDLMELSELGVPIYSIQGRGGGFKLLNERLLPPVAFTESEAVAIFFACESLKYYGSLPFGEGAASALEKFYHYLPPGVKEQIDRLLDKVVIWSPSRIMSSACLEVLLDAIMNRSAVTIVYHSGDGEMERDIQPVGLYADQGYWYCPAYCFSRQAYRLFRADRIQSARRNESVACLEEVDRRSIFDWNANETDGLAKTAFIVNLTAAGVRKLEPNGRLNSFIESNEDGSGTVRMSIPVRDLAFYAEMIWALGEDATIIEPAEAGEYIKEKLMKLLQRYC
jgi:predicted DNA-binding transcriptional regulator YafY